MIALHHGGASGHSAAVLIALAEKGLPFEDHVLDLARFEQHRAAYLALNPAGQVPLLREDGHDLTEAFLILLYLDEHHPLPALGGADKRARYNVQKWGKYVETHIAPNLAVLGWSQSGATLDAADRSGLEKLPLERRRLWEKAARGFDADQIAAARAALDKALGRIDADLAAAPWLAGPSYSLADIIVFPFAARIGSLGIAVPAAVADWIARVAARPQVQAALGATGLSGETWTMGPEKGRWG